MVERTSALVVFVEEKKNDNCVWCECCVGNNNHIIFQLNSGRIVRKTKSVPDIVLSEWWQLHYKSAFISSDSVVKSWVFFNSNGDHVVEK